MKQKCAILWSAAILAVAVSACSKSNPARPTTAEASPDTEGVVTAAANGTSMTSPAAVTPNEGHRFRFAEQPVTLTVRSAVTTGSTGLTYTFEVSTDASFATKTYTKDGVAETGNGQVALRIDRLPADRTYYWRARANAGTDAGPFNRARSFNVGPEVILQAPALVSPSNGGSATGNNPRLTVANAARTGPAGDVQYLFEISDSSSFGNLVATATIPEQAGQTTAEISTRLTP